MYDLLQDFYHGGLHPGEDIPPSPQYRAVQKKYVDHCDSFAETLKALDPPLDRQFLELVDEQIELHALESPDLFVYAFRLGAKMMLEILQDPK